MLSLVLFATASVVTVPLGARAQSSDYSKVANLYCDTTGEANGPNIIKEYTNGLASAKRACDADKHCLVRAHT